MRVVLLSKALLVGAYLRKAELLATEPDIDLTVIVPDRWRDGAREERLEAVTPAGYRLITTPVFRPGDFHLHFYPQIGRLLREIRPDVVHIDEEPYNLATYLTWKAARAAGARSLFFTWQNLYRRYPPPFSEFERRLYREIDGAIAGSHSAAEVLRSKGYGGRLWIIPQFGVDEAVFAPASKGGAANSLAPHISNRPRDDPTAPRPFTIGYAGRLVPAKGVDLLIEACSRLPRREEWRLVIHGDGIERTSLEAQAGRLGLAGRVAFRPWTASTDMPAFYQSIDALVLPSRSTPSWVEQFGRVLVEAMACEVPCIGTDSGEIPHVIGEAGLTFPEGDAAALAACLEKLLSDGPRRAELGRAGRQRVLDRFTMARVAAETAEVYRELV